jgi:hypothetical protein
MNNKNVKKNNTETVDPNNKGQMFFKKHETLPTRIPQRLPAKKEKVCKLLDSGDGISSICVL